MTKLAFAKGIWSYVCKMNNALREYSSRSRSRSTSVATMLRLIQTVRFHLLYSEILASGSLDHVRLWNANTAVCLGTHDFYRPIASIAFHAQGELLAVASCHKASGAWMLYKSNTCGEGFLFATLRGYSVIDAREGTKEELRLAIGKSGTIRYRSLDGDNGLQHMIGTQEGEVSEEPGHHHPVPSMLILDAIFRNALTSASLCIQRPKLLVYTETKIGVA